VVELNNSWSGWIGLMNCIIHTQYVLQPWLGLMDYDVEETKSIQTHGLLDIFTCISEKTGSRGISDYKNMVVPIYYDISSS
jgi:hypothetical protein